MSPVVTTGGPTLTMPPQSTTDHQSHTPGHGLATHTMRLARSWKWSLVLIGGFFYILSLTDSDIKRHFLRKISPSKESAVNSLKKVIGNNPQKTSAMSSRSNLTENKILEQEMEEFMSENQERKDLIK